MGTRAFGGKSFGGANLNEFYKFKLKYAPTALSRLNILFTHDESVNLNARLYQADGTTIVDTQYSTDNNEVFDISGL